MARIAVTSCVYLGDVAPYIPVARRLHEAGHDVVFVAPEGFRSTLADEPFEFSPYALDCSPRMMHADPLHTKLMRHPTRNMARLGRYWMDRAFVDDPEAAIRSLRQAFDGASAVVTHPTMGSVTIPLARSMGIPVVSGHLFPMMVPTRCWTPPLGSRAPRLPGPVSRLTWELLRSVAGRAFRDDVINAQRERLGFGPIRCDSGWAWLESDATVMLVSSHYYGPGAPDWPPITWGGFSVWDGPDGQDLPRDLANYVDDGDPPVVVMLGTSAASNAGAQFARIAGDLDRHGIRSVLLAGDPANLDAIRRRRGTAAFAPLTKLLPRCDVAVVSGALGGVAAALTAGVPVVIHPQLFDQVWHGRRVEQLGVGVLARRVSHVARAVQRIRHDPGYFERAAMLAERLRAEDGAAVLARTVDDLLNR